MEKEPEIKSLKDSLNEKIKKLYPNTKHIREYIINNDRVTFDGIEKSKKYTTLNKLMIFCKKFMIVKNVTIFSDIEIAHI